MDLPFSNKSPYSLVDLTVFSTPLREAQGKTMANHSELQFLGEKSVHHTTSNQHDNI